MENYFYQVVRFLVVCAAASVSIYFMVAKFRCSRAIRRLIAAGAVAVICFNQYVAWFFYVLLAGALAVFIVPAIIVGLLILLIKWFKTF